jgi:CheY-like chemotaxis protein
MIMAAKILIVEDNLPNHELVKYLLDHAGYITFSAWDGTEGMHILREANLDLVLCDLQMPVMNGYEMVRLLKTNEQLRQIPVIAVTASSMSGDSDKVIASGFDGYVSKPIDPESFVSQIEGFLPPGLRASSVAN